MRVGLTGGLGSGKSTVARLLAAHGAHVLSADDVGRYLMQPGQAVFAEIVSHFGKTVVQPDGQLDRKALAQLAFEDGRVEELNAIVHPAAIALQATMADKILAQDPSAVVVVESALIFESKYGGNWRDRFNHLVLVCAPEEQKIARYIARSGGGDPAALAAEARRRLAQMIPDGDKVHRVDYVLRNDSTTERLEAQVDRLWQWLQP